MGDATTGTTTTGGTTEATTRVDTTTDATTDVTTEDAAPATPRDWRALVRRAWPFVAMVLAAILWWPAGFQGRAEWMHLPLAQAGAALAPVSAGEVLLGCLVAAAVVSALVASAWPKFGIAAGLTAAAWTVSDADVTFAAGERPVVAALAALGMLLGLGVGARVSRGPVAVATFIALVAGLSPATYSRGLLLAVAVALPFWVATSDRVAPTVLAVVRVIVTWLVAVVVSTATWAGFRALGPGALADPPAAAPVVGRGLVDHVRKEGWDTVQAAPQVYTEWIWVAIVLAVAFVVAAAVLRRRRAKAS